MAVHAMDRSNVGVIEVIAVVAPRPRSRCLDLLHTHEVVIAASQYPSSIRDELLRLRLAVSRGMAAMHLLLLHLSRGVVYLVPSIGGRVKWRSDDPVLLLLLLADGQIAEVSIQYVGQRIQRSVMLLLG